MFQNIKNLISDPHYLLGFGRFDSLYYICILNSFLTFLSFFLPDLFIPSLDSCLTAPDASVALMETCSHPLQLAG